VPSTPSSPQGTQIWTADPVGPASGTTAQVVTGIIGEVRDFAGPEASIPLQWYVCAGQAVSRSTYAGAFAVLGTTWGAGDGSTTFNLPDLRGRVTAGGDAMGGVAASRITAGVSGMSGALGSTGGDQHAQTDTLVASSVVTDPGHLHTATTAASLPFVTPGVGIAGGGVGWNFNHSVSTESAVTGATVSTTVTSGLLGGTQNIQPTGIVNKIIFLGA
jgi:microcystin-dependent protein